MTRLLIAARSFIIPASPPADRVVAENFSQFDGFNDPTHKASEGTPSGTKPADQPTLTADLKATYSPLTGIRNVLGGMPLPVANPFEGDYGTSTAYPDNFTQQYRLGTPQGYQGVAQSVALGDITQTPPQTESIDSILAGWG
jgi:hypothetical protein